MKRNAYAVIFIIVFIGTFFIVTQLSQSDTVEFSFDEKLVNNTEIVVSVESVENDSKNTISMRAVKVTNGVIHSIPLDEIISGGPPKDGIPSIDNPKFVTAKKASFLKKDDIGLGISYNGETRFYPYQILVWHEIVNDTIAGDPILISYCPLCATGIAFDRRIDGVPQEFGVSGRLWKSNLIMYNRAPKESDESLWAQALGEAVVGPDTGKKLSIIRSNTVKWGDWSKSNPDTKVLSRDTGALRSYGLDPYGNYYQSRDVSFGASFNDNRLHPKTFVIGVQEGDSFKAYDRNDLIVGTTKDVFAGKVVEITKTKGDEVTVLVDGKPKAFTGSFWFSWLSIHPETELYTL